MHHVMIDIETLGLKEDCVVLSVGAVRFSALNGVGDGVHLKLDVADQVNKGRTIDYGTVEWWSKQGDQARAVLSSDSSDLNPANAMMLLVTWMDEAVGVWGNGSDFDNRILTNLCEDFGVEPWKFWKNRCFRTLRALHSDVVHEFEGTAHNALDDARNQAAHAVAIMRAKGLE